MKEKWEIQNQIRKTRMAIKNKRKVTVVGATTWGIALALTLAKNNCDVFLLTRNELETKDILKSKRIKRFINNISLPLNLIIDHNIDVIESSTIVVIAVPSSAFRQNLERIKRCISDKVIIVSGTKGLEENTSNRMSQIFNEILPKNSDRFCVLSGPNLAKEVFDRIPTTTILASTSVRTAKTVKSFFHSEVFYVFWDDDIVGVELGGSLKNIIVLAVGICDGLNYGDNIKSAIITMGLNEIQELAIKLGAKRKTIFGLSGLGDLTATAASGFSRNRFAGEMLGKGKNISTVLNNMDNVVEGIQTAKEAKRLADSVGLRLPIINAVNEILVNNLSSNKFLQKIFEENLE